MAGGALMSLAAENLLCPIPTSTGDQPARRLTASPVSCPALIVHVRDDEIIPFKQGRMLFEPAGEPKRFLELHRGHNDGFHGLTPMP